MYESLNSLIIPCFVCCMSSGICLVVLLSVFLQESYKFHYITYTVHEFLHAVCESMNRLSNAVIDINVSVDWLIQFCFCPLQLQDLVRGIVRNFHFWGTQ